VPRRVHEAASQWARCAATERVDALAGRTAEGRSQTRALGSELAVSVVELQTTLEMIQKRAMREASHLMGQELGIPEVNLKLIHSTITTVRIDGYLVTNPLDFQGKTMEVTVFNTFAPDKPDVELHELPGLCSHFVIDRDGTIYQLVPLGIMCRHTVGLNYTAFGIEHVGMSDADVMSNKRQMDASLRLTRWLRCRYSIGVGNVIGHSESLSSKYHRENVARLRTQTHGDWTHAHMQSYRARLGDRGACD